MDSQQNSQSVENCELHPITQIDGKLDFIFKRSLFWRPTYLAQSAWLEHIPFAFWLVETLRPRNIVELGTHYGSSYFSFCQAITKLDLETLCFAVDTWGGDEHAGQYGEEVYKQVSEYNQQHYSGFSTLIRSTFDQALDHFPQGSIDLLHIDGLHTFDAVRHDFESWLPKLSEKAVVIMHDTNVRERGFGVFQLLDELKQQYPHFEFAHGHGLGVIGVGSEQAAQMQNLYSVSENARATKQVQDIFYRLGKSCGESWENSQLKRQLTTQQEELQAEHQQLVEQQALERGRLAERITAQHNSLSALENQLAHAQAQADELALAQQHVNSLTSEMALLQQQVDEAQTNLSLGKQQRAQEQANLQVVEQTLETTSRQLAQVTAELDQRLAEKQSLIVQQSQTSEELKQAGDELKTALHQLEQQHDHIATQDRAQHQLQQQLNAQALQLSEETQRAAQLTLALSKSNGALTEHSRQLTALQLQLEQALHTQDAQTRALGERDNTVNLLQQRANALLQQLDDEGQIKSQLQRAYGLLEVQHDTLDHEHDALKRVNANLQQQLEEGQLAQQTLQLCIDEQTLALAAASQQCDELAQTVAAHEGTIAELHLECEQGNSQLVSLQQQLLTEQSEHQQHEHKLNQALSERFSETATLTQLLEEQTRTIAEQSHAMAVQQAERQQLTETLSALQQQLAVEQTTYQQQISERDQALAERFNETATLTRLLEEQAQTITAQETEKQLLATRLSGIEQQLGSEQALRQQAQAALVATTEEKQQQLDELEQVLSERFSEIATLTRWLEEREQALLSAASEQQQANETYRAQQQAWQEEQERLTRDLAQLQRQLADVQQQAQRRQAELEEQARELTARNEGLEANIAERFRELATMTDLVEQQSGELRNSEQQIEQLKARINKLKGTVSWRLTAPVRALAKPFKEVSHHSISQIKKISESGYFDEEWYRQQYPESVDTGSVIEHYLNIGAGKGYNPGPKFDTRWYLTMYPDVATGDINPLLHFIMHGQHEGRLCRSQS
ncbi:class I SAM-dependent methyltransferase [Aeromonas piscicola]|uniref:class I SAM-dependent methyltransferase n=1 Tax=Aeromonas piscicola TaxID=600645 RepID=UPI0028E7C801|nr:class I SAM-dependent methyltransferase [Aeromonas piscicola]